MKLKKTGGRFPTFALAATVGEARFEEPVVSAPAVEAMKRIVMITMAAATLIIAFDFFMVFHRFLFPCLESGICWRGERKERASRANF